MKLLELAKTYSGITALLIYLPALVLVLRLRQNIRERRQERWAKAREEKAAEKQRLDLQDEDALVACLVASIDYREEVKKDVRIVSVKEVK